MPTPLTEAALALGLTMPPDAPQVQAWRRSDGSYELEMVFPGGWAEAEVQVRGDDARDFGPLPPGGRVVIQGWAPGNGPLPFVLRLASTDGSGATWAMEAPATTIPLLPPPFQPGPERRSWSVWTRLRARS